MSTATIPPVTSLKRLLGFPALFVIAIGVVTAQSCFVSTLQGAGAGGAAYFWALLISFGLTLCYICTYAELSLMMPGAGSISTYTAVALGHFPAIIASIAGYLAPIVFGGPAELLLVDYILEVAYPGVFSQVGLCLLILLTIFNLLGINIFATIQNVLTYTMLTVLLVVGIAGFNPSGARGTDTAGLLTQFTAVDAGVFSLVVLALWAFLSIEFICPLIEETKHPRKNIPKTMFAAAGVILIIHSLVAFAGMRQLPGSSLAESDIPHWILVNGLFGELGRVLIAVITITTTAGFINTVLATLPKMLCGMAQQQQLPGMFMKIHPQYKSPWVGILFIAGAIAVPLLLLSKAKDVLIILVISSATTWLFTYIIAHINVMVLRKRYPAYKRPFRTPWYPLPQIAGILGMGYAIVKNAPTAELTAVVYGNTFLFIGITAGFAFCWIKFSMKKGLFEPEPIKPPVADDEAAG